MIITTWSWLWVIRNTLRQVCIWIISIHQTHSPNSSIFVLYTLSARYTISFWLFTIVTVWQYSQSAHRAENSPCFISVSSIFDHQYCYHSDNHYHYPNKHATGIPKHYNSVHYIRWTLTKLSYCLRLDQLHLFGFQCSWIFELPV